MLLGDKFAIKNSWPSRIPFTRTVLFGLPRIATYYLQLRVLSTLVRASSRNIKPTVDVSPGFTYLVLSLCHPTVLPKKYSKTCCSEDCIILKKTKKQWNHTFTSPLDHFVRLACSFTASINSSFNTFFSDKIISHSISYSPPSPYSSSHFPTQHALPPSPLSSPSPASWPA